MVTRSQNKIIQLLESAVDDETAIITFNASNGWVQQFDVTKVDDTYTWGYDISHLHLLYSKLNNPSTYPLVVVHRSFIRQWSLMYLNEKKRLIPHKNIRMWIIYSEQKMDKVPNHEAFAAMNTDSETGDLLPLDPTLHYI
jgi:hypothetical protein